MKYWGYLLFCLTTQGFAFSFPKDCKPLKLQNTLPINTESATLILMYNKSSSTLWLNKVFEHEMALGWASKLDAKKWSALWLKPTSMQFVCIESNPGHEQEIACAKVLKACKLTPAKVKTVKKSSYWVGENLSQAALIDSLAENGFDLPLFNSKTYRW